MNALEKQQNHELEISDRTADLIRAGVAPNTLKAYRHALGRLRAWLNSRSLEDGLLAEYITELHDDGKSPATISQAVAAVKWRAPEHVVGEITKRTLAGIRRTGKSRGRGQVDGLTWVDIERLCSFAEASKTLAGLRDSAMIRLMSDCLLRISEAVAVDVEDIDRVLTIHASKTDQEGAGVVLYVGEPTRRAIRIIGKRAVSMSAPCSDGCAGRSTSHPTDFQSTVRETP